MKIDKQLKILAVIPARGGSRDIPEKNIRPFCGKPLIYYTIREARKSKLFDRIIVSTNSPKIADLSKKYGAQVPYLRPENLAKDDSNVVDAVLNLLDVLKAREQYQPDLIFLLQPTSPLRQASDIIESFNLFGNYEAKSLVSVCRTHQQIHRLIDKKLFLINKESKGLINRQESDDVYGQDGSIFIINTETLIAKRDFMPRGTIAYITLKWKAMDIDNSEEFKLAEIIYRNRRLFNKKN